MAMLCTISSGSLAARGRVCVGVCREQQEKWSGEGAGEMMERPERPLAVAMARYL
jgi:hypothetical protein